MQCETSKKKHCCIVHLASKNKLYSLRCQNHIATTYFTGQVEGNKLMAVFLLTLFSHPLDSTLTISVKPSVISYTKFTSTAWLKTAAHSSAQWMEP